MTTSHTVHMVLIDYMAAMAYRATSGKLSPHSIRSYENSAGLLMELYPEGRQQTIQQLSIEDVRDIITKRLLAKYAPATVNHALAFLRGALRHCEANDIDTRDVLDIRTRKHTPEVLTDDEAEQLILETECNKRDNALIIILLTTGMRRSEILSIKRSDIEWDRSRILITGKGSKQRYIFLSPETIAALKRYMHPRKNWGVNPYLFPIKESRLYQIVKKYAKRCGFNKDITPHTLRHTFATMALRRTDNLEAVRKMMGHEYLSTTQQYLHMSDEDTQNVYNAAFNSAIVKPL